MLFAAGMGVGLLYWGTAEPLTHYALISEYEDARKSAGLALFVTNFHWGLHAWSIYALTGLVIAFFSFRLGCPSLVSAPIVKVFGTNGLTLGVGWLCDLLAIVAIAIGVGGSIAMGVFQVKEGLDALFGLQDTGMGLVLGIFVVLCLSYILPLMVDLGRGMAILSNTAMGVAGVLVVCILLTGPTNFLMGGIVQAVGDYIGGVVTHGFRTFTFMDDRVSSWFQSWTLTYMVWWLAPDHNAALHKVLASREPSTQDIKDRLQQGKRLPWWPDALVDCGTPGAWRSNLSAQRLAVLDNWN